MNGLNRLPSKQKELNSNISKLYSLNLAVFHRDEFIGWSSGFQSADNRYYMNHSGIVEMFQGKGLYSKLLEIILEQTKKEGFLEIYSNHNTDNNKIIIAKLKRGFFISGFEVLPKYGLTVQLSYSHSPELRAMHDFRAGRPLSDLIKDRFKDFL